MSSAPTASPSIPHAARMTTWLPQFLRNELAPYPGRGAIVARMVIAATITTILIAAFRIPGGAIGVILAIILSREDILTTTRSAFWRIVAFTAAGAFIPIGGRLFAGLPLTHFLWEAVSIFLCFFLLRIGTNFAVTTSFSLVVTNILAIWYLPGPASRNVELTLWQVASASIGALVTVAVELVFYAANKQDEVLSGIEVRLRQIQELMLAYADGKPIPPDVARELSRYAVVGMGGLRRHIARTADEPIHRMRISTLVSLAGRSIDFAAALATSMPSFGPTERQRAQRLAQHIAEICRSLPTIRHAQSLHPSEWTPEEGASTPLLNELDAMMSLIPSVLSSDTSLDPRLEILDEPRESSRIFVQDAFTNPEHLRYALSGTLAAMLCYILYMLLDWPAIATSVTTCVLTGLSNIGSSRQKQVLRIAGALFGGFILGMGSQVFVLPYLDTIGGFALLCAVAAGIASWVSTSSSRLSYAGLQIALAFNLIMLSEPTIQLSLSIARDRVLGVLLGISMMWLVFERFYPRPAANEMVDIFIRNLRLIAHLIEITSLDASASDIVRIRRQREQIYRNFGEVTAQSDAVPFETGPQRVAHMAARDRIRRWQTTIRTFYLLQVPLLQFRIYADAAQRHRPFYRMEDSFREACAQIFRQTAASLESQLEGKPPTMALEAGSNAVLANAIPALVPLMEMLQKEQHEELTEREQALLRMVNTIASIVDRMAHEVAMEPLFANP